MKVLLVLFLCYNFCTSQNIIYNGSFELYSKCPNDYSEIEKAKGWKMPSNGTSDYFNSCSKSTICSVPKNVSGYSNPYSGEAYAGFGLFFDESISYEFIQTKLLSKLNVGKEYCLELYVKTASSTNYNFNELSFLFSGDQIIIDDKNFYTDFQIQENLFYDFKLLNADKNKWVKISLKVKPKNEVEFLTIGFNKINITNQIKRLRKKETYFYIDDVSLKEIKDSNECKCINEQSLVKNVEVKKDSLKNNKYDEAKDKPLVLSNIVFESNKANLLPISNKELNQLVDYLKQNNPYKIELSGYTDKTGKEIDNIKLSEARAKAVADFLIKAGVNEKRIIYKGFGSLNPKMPNTTEENKQINRRVEFTFKK